MVKLAARAARSGRSLQEYLLRMDASAAVALLIDTAYVALAELLAAPLVTLDA